MIKKKKKPKLISSSRRKKKKKKTDKKDDQPKDKKKNFLKTMSGKLEGKKNRGSQIYNSSPSIQINNDIAYASAVDSMIENPLSISHAKKIRELIESDENFQSYLLNLGAPKVANLIFIISHFIPNEV